MAAKSFDTMGRWLSDSAMVNYNIRERTIPTKYGESSLLFFDGATMQSYAYPSKASEVVFCRRHGDLQNCKVGHGFDQENESLPVSVIEVRTLDDRRGVFATRDISQSSYIGLADAVHGVYVKSPASNLLDRMAKRLSPVVPGTVTKFIDAFGRKQLRSVSRLFRENRTMVMPQLTLTFSRTNRKSRPKRLLMHSFTKHVTNVPMSVRLSI